MKGTEPVPVWNMLMNDTGTMHSKILLTGGGDKISTYK